MKVMCETGQQAIEVGKILPCPFCGEVDNLVVTNPETFQSLVEENGGSLINITCRRCRLDFKLYDIPDNNYMMGLGRLVERWNHRA